MTSVWGKEKKAMKLQPEGKAVAKSHVKHVKHDHIH